VQIAWKMKKEKQRASTFAATVASHKQQEV